MFNFLRKSQSVFQNGCLSLTFQRAVYKGSSFSTIPCNVSLFNYSPLNGCVTAYHCDLISTTLMTNNVEHLFICFLAICINFFGEISIEVFCSFLIGFFLYNWLVKFLYMFEIKDLYCICNMPTLCCQSVACLFTFLSILWSVKVFKHFNEVNFYFLSQFVLLVSSKNCAWHKIIKIFSNCLLEFL